MNRSLSLGGVALGSLGVASAVSAMYESMREVMVDNGGTCASGGPYQVAAGHQCSGSSTLVLTVAPFVGLGLAALLVAASNSWSGGRVSGIGALLWFGLFGAFGWNFFDLGVNPPASMSSTGAWIFCAVLFWVMSLAGLVYAGMALREYFFPGSAGSAPSIKLPPIVRASVRPTALPGANAGTDLLNRMVKSQEESAAAVVGNPWAWLATVLVGSGMGVWIGVLLYNAA